MTLIRSLTSFKLDLPPSCIEFFPLNPQYAIIGTYNLEKPDEEESAGSAPHDGKVSKKNQQRNGSLILVRVQGENVYVNCDFCDFFEAVGSVIDL
jgi:diphthamide biosynthesis protein 7